ncbi:Actin-like 6A [Blomia tropicalis]|nr:Actin-like 6A [Blomia tropicalis]
MTNVYGGDEVGAVVIDVGSYSCKVGYAGEDSPRSEIPTVIGVQDKSKFAAELDRYKSDTETDRTKQLSSQINYYINPTEMIVPKSGQEVKTFLRDGIIEDFELFDKMISYIYDKHIRSKPDQHPLMFSEVCWNTNIARQKLAELMFEKYHVPAMYPAPNAMLVAFSTGRPTGLVFDSGANQTSAIAVLEGHVLYRSLVKSVHGGESINRRCCLHLRDKQVEINPIYRVKSKKYVEAGQPAEWIARTLPDRITDSYKKHMLLDVLRDYKHSVVKVCPDGPYDPEEFSSSPDIEYHFPDGYNMMIKPDDQYQLMEPYFDPDYNNPTSESVAKCDADIRASLLNSVILTGGNTLIPGFTERMTNELYSIAPKNFRVKIAQNCSSVERKYAAWIGGSILASLGTFQQLWVSKLEYDEKGNSCLNLESRF